MLTKSFRRAALIGVFFVVALSVRANASPVLVTMFGQFPTGPLQGTLFAANFVYDGLAPGQIQPSDPWRYVPLSFWSINGGGKQLLSQFNPPNANWIVHFEFWGPLAIVPQTALPAGLTNWGFGFELLHYFSSIDSATGLETLSLDNCHSSSPNCHTSFSQLPARSVPEPMSPTLAFGAIAGIALLRKLTNRIL